MCGVISPGQADDFHRVALGAEVIYQHAVVEVAAAEGVERAINDKSDFHWVCMLEGQRFSQLTFQPVNLKCCPCIGMFPQNNFQRCDVLCLDAII